MSREQLVYQHEYSKDHPELFNMEGREAKAEKILAVLADYWGKERLRELVALDVGCSGGIITATLSPHFKHTYGADIDEHAIAFANEKFASDRLEFRKSDGLRLNIDDASIDIALCTQVYEHVPDAELLMAEIYRVLKPGGVCYFSAGNRLAVMEPHYKLPFLSVVPKAIAHRYLKVLGRGDHYYETHRTLWGLKALTSRFEIIDYTERVLREPEKFHMGKFLKSGTLLHRAVPLAVRALYWAIPNYIWLLKKPATT